MVLKKGFIYIFKKQKAFLMKWYLKVDKLSVAPNSLYREMEHWRKFKNIWQLCYLQNMCVWKWQYFDEKCWFHVLLCSLSENCVADIFLPSVSCSRGPHKLVGRLQHVVCRQQQLLHMHVKLGLSAMLELLCLVHVVYKMLPHRSKVHT